MPPVLSHVLDNPIWNALTTRQQSLSVGGNLARRFDSSIGPFAGLREQSPEAYAELASTLAPGQPAVLVLDEALRLPAGWRILREIEIIHMTCPAEPHFAAPIFPAGNPPELTPLTHADVPEMLDLVQLTEPGPFAPRTIDLGGYIGIKIENRLAAMAGYRVAPPGYREISAVCTHADFRGRGYAHYLTATVARNIRALGDTPYLTAFAENHGAIRVYEAVGFVLRRSLQIVAITL